MGLDISHEIADQITMENLLDVRKNLLKDIERSVVDYHFTHEQQNLRDHYENLFALERMLYYFGGNNWRDKTTFGNPTK